MKIKIIKEMFHRKTTAIFLFNALGLTFQRCLYPGEFPDDRPGIHSIFIENSNLN